MALPVPSIDEFLGIGIYATQGLGVGGVIRESVNDFVVEEVLVDNTKATIDANVPSQVLGSTSHRQRYLLCKLVKRNWDTFITLKNVAKQLGINQNRVQNAGIKDAKAVTAQFITIEGCNPEDTSKINVKDVEVVPIGYVHEMLSAYYLLGNYFTIKIKDIKLPKETVEGRASKVLGEIQGVGGIPNFFGHQRFGTTRPITHQVGKALFKGDFKEAAMTFLAKPSALEHPSSRQAREQLQVTGDFKAALENFPKQLRFERLMLAHLTENPADYAGAFKRLPLKLQALFVQAHQSYLFNLFLSERLKKGLLLNRAEVGDFVAGVERSGLPMVNAAKIVTEDTLSKVNEFVAAGKMRVCLPIVGVKQKLSGGIMGEIEREVLREEGAGLDGWGYSLVGGRGGVRAVITPVKDSKLSVNVDDEKVSVELTFMLHRGSYATVLLREVIKPVNPIKAGF